MTPASHPNMSALFEGNLASRRQLLQQWLVAGEVADQAESNLVMSKTKENELDEEEQLLTVEGMRRAGVSEYLFFYQLRQFFLFTFPGYFWRSCSVIVVNLCIGYGSYFCQEKNCCSGGDTKGRLGQGPPGDHGRSKLVGVCQHQQKYP